MKNKEFYLKKVVLEKYKSIQKLSTEFNPELNIVIGKNATGKSNFLELLYKSLLFNYSEMLNTSTYLEFVYYSDTVELFSSTKIIKTKEKILNEKKQTLKVNGEELELRNLKRPGNLEFLAPILIKHGVPDNYYIVDKPFSIERSDLGFTEIYFKTIVNNEIPYFVRFMLFQVILGLQSGLDTEKKLKNNIIKIVDNCLSSFKDELAKISIIQDVRLRNEFNIILTDNNKQISIHNLVLEFKVEDNWFLFSDLSDGTKRIFYIISEVLTPVAFTIKDKDIILPTGEVKKIILLEEPELGIHPHQLHLLSLFLKEQSKVSQIILTTHSPQLLNILDPDELDSIIISSIDKEGTNFRHLSAEEKLKAQDYMLNQAFLSDYWTFSDLEK